MLFYDNMLQFVLLSYNTIINFSNIIHRQAKKLYYILFLNQETTYNYLTSTLLPSSFLQILKMANHNFQNILLLTLVFTTVIQANSQAIKTNSNIRTDSVQFSQINGSERNLIDPVHTKNIQQQKQLQSTYKNDELGLQVKEKWKIVVKTTQPVDNTRVQSYISTPIITLSSPYRTILQSTLAQQLYNNYLYGQPYASVSSMNIANLAQGTVNMGQILVSGATLAPSIVLTQKSPIQVISNIVVPKSNTNTNKTVGNATVGLNGSISGGIVLLGSSLDSNGTTSKSNSTTSSLNTTKNNSLNTNSQSSLNSTVINLSSGSTPQNVSITTFIKSLDYVKYLQKYKPYSLSQKSSSNLAETVAYREALYQKNMQTINKHNLQAPSTLTYMMGPNIFTDIAQDQFIKKYAKLKISEAYMKDAFIEQLNNRQNNNGEVKYSTPTVDANKSYSINWSCQASPVLNQGACAATHAIAALQSVQITMKIHSRIAVYLSIQQFISCSNTKKDACNSGFFDTVFTYVQSSGIGQSTSYFYDQKAKQQGVISDCNKAITGTKAYQKTKVFIKQFKRIKFADCQTVVNQLKTRSIAVSIAAEKLQFYQNGTFTTTSTNINHGVTLVGYSSKQKFYIKNSWSMNWGMEGFAFVDQTSGICNYAVYPVLKGQSTNNEDIIDSCGPNDY